MQMAWLRSLWHPPNDFPALLFPSSAYVVGPSRYASFWSWSYQTLYHRSEFTELSMIGTKHRHESGDNQYVVVRRGEVRGSGLVSINLNQDCWPAVCSSTNLCSSLLFTHFLLLFSTHHSRILLASILSLPSLIQSIVHAQLVYLAMSSFVHLCHLLTPEASLSPDLWPDQHITATTEILRSDFPWFDVALALFEQHMQCEYRQLSHVDPLQVCKIVMPMFWCERCSCR